MEEKIKDIVSRYTKIPVDQITSATIIDRSAVANSILLHRMYGGLANEGFVVENYWDVKNFGALLQRINGVAVSNSIQTVTTGSTNNNHATTEINNSLIGVDIEKIALMPEVNDYREDEFYKMNFSVTEIAYCILQPNPLASFAGLFAVKEAIVKADNTYKNQPFNTIFIDHLPNGKPVHKDFQVSISHTDELAIAMVAHINTNSSPVHSSTINESNLSSKKQSTVTFWLALLAFFLSLTALFLHFIRTK